MDEIPMHTGGDDLRELVMDVSDEIYYELLLLERDVGTTAQTTIQMTVQTAAALRRRTALQQERKARK